MTMTQLQDAKAMLKATDVLLDALLPLTHAQRRVAVEYALEVLQTTTPVTVRSLTVMSCLTS